MTAQEQGDNSASPTSAPQACKRCYLRKRKSQCDRRRPRCTNCVEAKVQCEVSVKTSKRTLLIQTTDLQNNTKELQERIDWLEAFIVSAHSHLAGISDLPTGHTLDSIHDQGPTPQSLRDTHNFVPSWEDTSSSPVPDQNHSASPDLYLSLSALATSGLVMRDSFDTAADVSSHSVYTSAAHNPRFPAIETALEYARAFLGEYKQGYHCVALDEIEEDLNLVYGENGLTSPNFAASRFRSFTVLYLWYCMRRGTEILNETDKQYAQTCRSFAMRELTHVLAQENLLAVQALTLLCAVAIHEPGGPSIWQLLGLAARTAIALDLHRRDDVYLASVSGSMDQAVLIRHNEGRKNLFWALYSLDRLTVLTLSRPPAIQDAIIDVEFPSIPVTRSSIGVSDVALRIHNLQLRIIYGKVYESLYAVSVKTDRPRAEGEAIVADLMRQIQSWYSSSPLKVPFAPISEATTSRQVTDDISYHQVVMALHRPSRLISDVSSDFIRTLKGSADISVDLYRHYWSKNQVIINWNHLCQLFTSCITLAYCFTEHISRPDLNDIPASEIIRRFAQCQDLLARFGPTWPESQKYQTMFNALVAPLVNSVVTSQQNPVTNPADNTDSCITASVTNTDSTGDESVDDMSWLLNELLADTENVGNFSPNAVIRGLWDDNTITNL
ncbi:hypothetical protein BCR39DRAFT_163840 [Naematelia encephala]|uniref:Fungal-specific transcription factor domain-domain-containing protein n=1 Tax=Naematelia encephala TaxID=71784 RepID=A0A1Y2B511_9TREE|nr:hypothetical protein BCR39DRAFT_163840 [Naematelia encephala]